MAGQTLENLGKAHARACLIACAALLVACQTPPEAGFEDRQEVKEALTQYRHNVMFAMVRFKRYPRSALENKQEGSVELRLAITRDGRIENVAVEQSSGHTVLDAQALDMVNKAKPVVPIPEILRGHEFSVPLRIIFDLQNRPN